MLFSLQNTEPTTIQIVQGVQLQAPLCVELILATGLGAILAWIFSLWSRMQRMLAYREQQRQDHQKQQRIQTLEQDLERYKAEIEEKRSLPALTSEPSPRSEIEAT